MKVEFRFESCAKVTRRRAEPISIKPHVCAAKRKQMADHKVRTDVPAVGHDKDQGARAPKPCPCMQGSARLNRLSLEDRAPT